MLKINVEAVNLKGETVTKEVYFQFEQQELIQLTRGDIGKFRDNLIEQDPMEGLKVIEEMIELSYCVREEDMLYKDEDEFKKFKRGPFYRSLLNELMSNPERMVEFIKNMFTDLDQSGGELSKAIDEAAAKVLNDVGQV